LKWQAHDVRMWCSRVVVKRIHWHIETRM